MKKITILLLILLINSPINVFATSATSNSYTICQGVTINLPDGWIEIPKDVIDKTFNEISTSQNIEPVDYDYGFQFQLDSGYFSYPYILVKIKNEAKVPYSEWQNICNTGINYNAVSNEVENELNGLLSEMSMEVQYVNKINYQVISSFKADTNNNTVIGYFINQLTNNGYITIYIYTLESEFTEFEKSIESIIDNITVSKNAVYKNEPPNNTAQAIVNPSRDISSFFTAGVGSLIAAGAATLVLRMLRPTKKKISPTTDDSEIINIESTNGEMTDHITEIEEITNDPNEIALTDTKKQHQRSQLHVGLMAISLIIVLGMSAAINFLLRENYELKNVADEPPKTEIESVIKSEVATTPIQETETDGSEVEEYWKEHSKNDVVSNGSSTYYVKTDGIYYKLAGNTEIIKVNDDVVIAGLFMMDNILIYSTIEQAKQNEYVIYTCMIDTDSKKKVILVDGMISEIYEDRGGGFHIANEMIIDDQMHINYFSVDDAGQTIETISEEFFNFVRNRFFSQNESSDNSDTQTALNAPRAHDAQDVGDPRKTA